MATLPSAVTAADDVLNLKQVARLLDVHYVTAYRYVRHGELPAWREGAVWHVARTDVDALIEERAGEGRPRSRAAGALADHLATADEVAAWRVLRGQAATPAEAHAALLAAAASALREGDGEPALVGPVVRRLVDRLGALAVRPGRSAGTVAVVPPSEDPDGLAAPVATNLLRAEGWRAIELAPGGGPVARGVERVVVAPALSLTDGRLPDLASLSSLGPAPRS